MDVINVKSIQLITSLDWSFSTIFYYISLQVPSTARTYVILMNTIIPHLFFDVSGKFWGSLWHCIYFFSTQAHVITHAVACNFLSAMNHSLAFQISCNPWKAIDTKKKTWSDVRVGTVRGQFVGMEHLQLEFSRPHLVAHASKIKQCNVRLYSL